MSELSKGMARRVGGPAWRRKSSSFIDSSDPIPRKYMAWRGLTIVRGTSMTVSSCARPLTAVPAVTLNPS
jgi:hypothetical protein